MFDQDSTDASEELPTQANSTTMTIRRVHAMAILLSLSQPGMKLDIRPKRLSRCSASGQVRSRCLRPSLKIEPPRSETGVRVKSRNRTRKLFKANNKTVWLAPTAPWSFVARLAVMMSEKLNLDSRETPKFHLDGDIYPLDWINLPIIQEHYSAVPLPSVDQALHAYNTVQFYLGQIYRLLDEDFPAQIRHFYERRAAGEVVYSRMWFIQLLLVLAFGKAFSLKTKTDGDPAGSKMFLRAMSLMPNHTFTGKESLVVIETLTLISLYLYSIDHREGAHSHVS